MHKVKTSHDQLRRKLVVSCENFLRDEAALQRVVLVLCADFLTFLLSFQRQVSLSVSGEVLGKSTHHRNRESFFNFKLQGHPHLLSLIYRLHHQVLLKQNGSFSNHISTTFEFLGGLRNCNCQESLRIAL